MAHKPCLKTLFPCLVFLLGFSVWFPPVALSETLAETMTLSQAIEIAMTADLSLKSSREGIAAADEAKKAQRTQFFPAWGVSYEYNYNDEGQSISPVLNFARTEVTLATTLTQPIFTGFALENRYKLTGLALNRSEVQEKLVRQDVSLRVKQAYFNLLKFRKLLLVAQKTVEQIEAQKNVAENFYQVGMTPMNDLLQAQVELANASQALTVAGNNLEIARSNFNTILRRPIGEPVNLEDIIDYTPFMYDLEYCQEEAKNNRLETTIADLEIEMATKEIELARVNYYPTVNFRGTYFRVGDEWNAKGGEAVFNPDGWNIAATASWSIWEWGKTRHGVNEKRRRFSQVKYNKENIVDRIRLEVKETFIRTREAEENIKTVEKAIEQAKENYRINQERYKEQVATNTDVLIAQTLLTQTMTSYYNALYDYQLSKASLFRAMGREEIE